MMRETFVLTPDSDLIDSGQRFNGPRHERVAADLVDTTKIISPPYSPAELAEQLKRHPFSDNNL